MFDFAIEALLWGEGDFIPVEGKSQLNWWFRGSYPT
jgi:hypothetical protein